MARTRRWRSGDGAATLAGSAASAPRAGPAPPGRSGTCGHNAAARPSWRRLPGPRPVAGLAAPPVPPPSSDTARPLRRSLAPTGTPPPRFRSRPVTGPPPLPPRAARRGRSAQFRAARGIHRRTLGCSAQFIVARAPTAATAIAALKHRRPCP